MSNLLTKLGVFFFKAKWLSVALWLIIGFSSIIIYSNVIKKEGYPQVQYPITIINGAYLGEAEEIDEHINQPLTKAIYKLEDVTKVSSSAFDNSFRITVEFDENIKAQDGTNNIRNLINNSKNLLNNNVDLQYITYTPTEYLFQYSVLVAVYTDLQTPTSDLQKTAQAVASIFIQDEEINDANVLNLQQRFIDINNVEEIRQTKFNYLSLYEDHQVNQYSSIMIGLTRNPDSDLDLINFSKHVDNIINQLNFEGLDHEYSATIAADYGRRIDNQIQSLQSNLLTALITVIIISLVLISWRTSLVIAIFIILSLLTTILILFLIGYNLNLIVLFSLVLSLGLLVDDAIIIAENINSQTKKLKDKYKIITASFKKVATASMIGTLTTVLAFTPLLFVSGLLGEFIHILPVTIIIALLTSFILSIILIPFLSRFLLLTNFKKRFSIKLNYVANLEDKVSTWLSDQILKLKDFKNKKAYKFPIITIVASLILVILSFNYANRLQFNIFPNPSDSNRLSLRINFPDDYSFEESRLLSLQINQIISDDLNNNLEKLVYLEADKNMLNSEIYLTQYQNRNISAPQLVNNLKESLNHSLGHYNLDIEILVLAPGIVADEYPLKVQIFENELKKAQTLAEEIKNKLTGLTLQRNNGTEFYIEDVRLPNYNHTNRINNQKFFELAIKFSDTDVSTLVRQTTSYLNDEFNNSHLIANGFNENSLKFDSGTDADNLESFRSLIYIMPIILVTIYLLLSFNFRSFFQPLLILLAIPFSFFGVFAGLYYTNNVISFFTILGLAGLMGIAINNTILLTDYINQNRRQRKGLIESVALAVKQRFRPLITTSITTIVALIPLALNDPLWEGLSITIIFGLLSSTVLVILAFPYYFIVFELIKTEIKNLKKKKIRFK